MASIFDKWKQNPSNLKNKITTGVNNAKSKVSTWLDSLKNSQAKTNNLNNGATTANANATALSATTNTATKPNVAMDNTAQQTTPTAPQIAPPKAEETTQGLPAPETQNPTQPATPETPNQPTADNSNFLNWYKSQYGADYNGTFNRSEGMSDKDYETGNNLYQGYIQQQNLKNQYDSANQALEQSKDTQRQEASILRDKMAKYLQLQNKNNGMENLGVAQTTGLHADTNYMNNLGKIEADVGDKKQDLLNNYVNNKTNIESQTAQGNQDIMNKYQQYAREDEQKEYDRSQDDYNKQKYEEEQAYQKEQDDYNKKKYEEEQAYQKEQDAYNKQKYDKEMALARQDSNFNEFMTVIESGSFNTAEELEGFYNTYKDALSPEQQKLAEQQINFYKNNPDQREIDKQVEDTKPQVTDNGDGTTTEKIDNGDGTTTEVTKDTEGKTVDTKTGLKIDTSSGHNKYVSKSGVTISSPSDNQLKITYGSNNNDHANNYDITYNGNLYKVEVGDEFSGTNDQLQEIYQYMRESSGRNEIKEGDCVLYDGKLYIASNTGRLWTIKDRSKFWALNWGGKTASDLNAEFKKNFG